MPSLYTITEPHPTVPQDSYTHSGRGGLGNFFRAPATTSPSGVPTPSHTTKTTSNNSSNTPRRFYSGRGGAGNAHQAHTSAATPSFDEEFALRESALTTVVGHVGRGGAGNVFSSSGSKGGATDGGVMLSRRDSASTEGSARSEASSSSSLAGFWGRVKSKGR
ncbi:hypothetical protein CHGG_07092 [Chaetomium globosum CBS 148.51]|uniref:Uncharacterized protein n=1 Tax=Chaetomium globosum (strain ATCC 6205 / CBS 148.51 / DSM 1962 / NBRC 6347 / NRRL 1970) TaxID=306901 RepID=Q2GY62_CHAGB|nr:uncharacterized protein CHGG_07092 [Chaetomium globosum CBS 148.51]EAQ85839.1 hypothetical protein CHGG_07092 [Chaetomium globosum CBS 148.51]